MFGKLKDFFAGGKGLQVDASGKPTDKDLQIASVVLLLEMAGHDQDFAPEEVTTIFQSIGKHFQLSEDETADLLESADGIREQHEKIDQFVQIINQRFDENQKQRLFALIWKVIIADGKIDQFEQRFALQMQNRFQLSNEAATAARRMAESGGV